MTERERCTIEYERSFRSARRVLVLAVIMLVGALLGYRTVPTPDAPFVIGSSYAP